MYSYHVIIFIKAILPKERATSSASVLLTEQCARTVFLLSLNVAAPGRVPVY